MGTWVAYAWATRHPQGVDRLILTEAAVPGVTADAALPLAAAPNVFQFYFNAVEKLPELLTQGREREFLDWLFRSKTMVKDAIGEADLEHYVQSYRRPGRMSAGFAYYRALLQSIAQNKAATPPTMPVLALGGEGGVGETLYTALKARASQTEGGAMAGVGPLHSRRGAGRVRRARAGLHGGVSRRRPALRAVIADPPGPPRYASFPEAQGGPEAEVVDVLAAALTNLDVATAEGRH